MSGYDTVDATPGSLTRRDEPQGWKRSSARNKTPYYVNDITKVVSWTNPSTGKSEFIANLEADPASQVIDSNSIEPVYYDMGNQNKRLSRHVTIVDNVDNDISKEERKRLSDAFSSRGFHVLDPKVKLTSVEMMDLLETNAKAQLQRHSCTVFIMFGEHSSASRDLIQCSDEMHIDVEDVVEPFRGTKSLVGKPKLFIFRCFSYTSSIEDDTLSDSVPEEVQDKAFSGKRIRIPLWADSLCLFCPTTTHKEKHPFVERFCTEIDNTTGKKNLMDAIRKANRRALVEWKQTHLNRSPKVASCEFTLTKEWELPHV